MTKTSTLIRCLYDIAPDYPKAPLEDCGDRLATMRGLLEQCLPLVRQAAFDPTLDPEINFACARLVRDIEENLE